MSERNAAFFESYKPATANQWDEWLRLFASRDEVVEEYASCLSFYGAEWPYYRDFNAAILRRWSPSGLSYIKRKAWAEVAGV